MPLFNFVSRVTVALSLCLARMLVVEGTLLERSEWIRSFCHLGSPTDRYRMEKRGQKSLFARTRF